MSSLYYTKIIYIHLCMIFVVHCIMCFYLQCFFIVLALIIIDKGPLWVSLIKLWPRFTFFLFKKFEFIFHNPMLLAGLFPSWAVPHCFGCCVLVFLFFNWYGSRMMKANVMVLEDSVLQSQCHVLLHSLWVIS